MCMRNGLTLRAQPPRPSPRSAAREAAAGSRAGHRDCFQTSDPTEKLTLLCKALTEHARSLASMVKCLQQNK